MKRYIVLFIAVVLSTAVPAQVSTTKKFLISIDSFKSESTGNLNFYFITQNGVMMKQCDYRIDSTILRFSGSYWFIVGVGLNFPTLVVSKIMEENSIQRIQYYYINLVNFQESDDSAIHINLGLIELDDTKPYIFVRQNHGAVNKEYYKHIPDNLSNFDHIQHTWVAVKRNN